MRCTSKTFGTVVTVGAITILALLSGTATAAANRPPDGERPPGCPAPRTANLDDGYGVMRGTFNLKSGPYAGGRCGTVTTVGAGRILYFHCWTRNDRGNRWVYARVKGSRAHGWMSIDNLRDIRNTSFAACDPNIHPDRLR